MWICPRCRAENREAAAACERCGAARSAGRFAAPAPRPDASVRAPRITVPAPADSPRPVDPARAASRPAEPEGRVLPPGRPLRRLARLTGSALCVLLPLLTALLAWRQYDALSAVLTPLLLGENAAEGVKMACYIGLALAAGLLSLLPGLWTLLLCGPRPSGNRE